MQEQETLKHFCPFIACGGDFHVRRAAKKKKKKGVGFGRTNKTK